MQECTQGNFIAHISDRIVREKRNMSEKSPLHIAVFPWLAFGHMNPFLQLAIALANAGQRVSYLCTPRNISRLPKVPSHLASRISFVELQMPAVDGLPEDAENTKDIPYHQVPFLKQAYDLLQDQIKEFLANESPDCIIPDFLPHWIIDVARETGVRCVAFCTYPAHVMAFVGVPETRTEEGMKNWWPSAESLTTLPKWFTFKTKMAYRQWEAQMVYWFLFNMNDSGTKDIDRILNTIEGCSAVIFLYSNEFGAEYVELIEKLYGKPVIPTGLLPPTTAVKTEASKKENGSGGNSHSEVFRWLDGQQPKSVLYVSFGSEYKMSKEELNELAYGLELSGIPFLWVLQRPPWLTGDNDEALPEGFRSRNQARGMVSFGWAPQLEILAHAAIGGSLFHGGWNSVIETLRYGHALVVLPGLFDQGLNARLLEEKGLGIEVVRGDADGSFDRNDVAKALKTAMLSDEGKKLQANTKAMGAMIADQALHDKYIKEFIDFLLRS